MLKGIHLLYIINSLVNIEKPCNIIVLKTEADIVIFYTVWTYEL